MFWLWSLIKVFRWTRQNKLHESSYISSYIKSFVTTSFPFAFVPIVLQFNIFIHISLSLKVTPGLQLLQKFKTVFQVPLSQVSLETDSWSGSNSCPQPQMHYFLNFPIAKQVKKDYVLSCLLLSSFYNRVFPHIPFEHIPTFYIFFSAVIYIYTHTQN